MINEGSVGPFPLPMLLADIRTKKYDEICALLNQKNNWCWFAQQLGISQNEIQEFEKSKDSSRAFMDYWVAQGATTESLLKILSIDQKRIEIILSLADTYIIP